MVAEIAYLRGPESEPVFAQVFEDLAAVLGKRAQVLSEAVAALDPARRVVLAPGGKLTSLPPQRSVALAPQPALEAALGLTKPATKRMQGCVLKSSHADMPLLGAAPLPLPVEGTLSVYGRASDSAQVLAVVACADGEHPALFRLERAAAEPAYMFAFNVLESIVLTRQGRRSRPAIWRTSRDRLPGVAFVLRAVAAARGELGTAAGARSARPTCRRFTCDRRRREPACC